MLLDTKIDIPTEKGKIVLQKKCLCTYVLLTVSRQYDPETQLSKPKRVTIGKVCPDDPTKMFPNEKFFEYFPDTKSKKTKKDKTTKTANISDSSSNLEEELLPPPYRSDSLCIGPYTVIKSIVNDNNLKDCLVDTFGEDSAALTLDIASYLIVTEGNQALHYPAYAWEHALFTKNMHIYSDSSISRHLKRITQEDVRKFLYSWNQNASRDDFINISYDSTNKNSQAGDLDLVGFGKPKVDMGTGIINVAIAYNQTNECPLFYEAYPGAIPDVCQLKFAVRLAVDYGYKFIRFIIDRGYFSRENIEYIDENGYQFVMMVKGYKTLVAPHIEPLIGTFERNFQNRIEDDLFGTTIEQEFCGRTRYFHVYYNLSNGGSQSQNFLNSLDFDKLVLEKNIGRAYAPSSQQKQFFNLKFTSDGVLIGFTFNDAAVNKKLQLFGYFSIITSEKMTATEAYILYKSRDVSEKLFCSSKTFIGSHCFRVHSNQALYGKLFIEFVALILRNRIYVLLRKELVKRGKSCKYLNVPAAIRELHKIRISRAPGSNYRLLYQLTKEQKDILAPFGISMQTVQEIAKETSMLLAKVDSKTSHKDAFEDELNSIPDKDFMLEEDIYGEM